MYRFKRRVYAKIQIVISKHKIVLLSSSCILAVLLILLSLNVRIFQSDSIQFTPNTSYAAVRNANEPLAYACCTPLNGSLRTNVYFVKTHKTGGSTVQNVILRFALTNSLDVMNVIYNTYFWQFSDWSIYPQAKSSNNKYHIMAHHVRYSPILKSYQYPDTSMVTILRHPVTQFKSLYTYFEMNLTTGMNFQQFLNAPKKPPILSGTGSPAIYRGYNQMSIDLGFDLTQSKDKTAIAEFIEKIDREFDLVMIMEYMEPSMVLLANLMGWPLENMAYLKLNARLPELDTYKLSLRDEFTIMDLNEVDTMLYYHFRNKFRKCIRQYGEEKMKRQIQRLKIINEQFAQRCVTEEVRTGIWFGAPKTVEYFPKNQSDLQCVYASDVFFFETVFKAQSLRLRNQKQKWK